MIVKTAYGEVDGFEDDGILKWLGIPFAMPPIGPLRFRRAQAPDPWEGTLECKEFATRPVQFSIPPDAPDVDMPEGEDCLYLNVLAPAGEKEHRKIGLPVFIYIYGGAYLAGDTHYPGYDLTSFARHGAIGVSIPYRLGPLGFFLLGESSERFDSNCGFSDVAAGIKWVHENIESFGGDPDNITICGESAGGTMVLCALASPALKGCFSKAISMSGLPDDVVAHRAQRIATDMLLENLGIDAGNPHSVEEIAGIPIEKLLDATKKFVRLGGALHPGMQLIGPIVGDDLLPKSVWDSLADGNAKDVDCIIGTCRDEGTLFSRGGMSPGTWEGVEKMFADNGYPDLAERARELYGDDETAACDGIARDKMFWTGSMKAALVQSSQANVYVYRYDYVSSRAAARGLGAMHTSDTCPSLDVHWEGSLYADGPEDEVETMHRNMHGSFLSFCRTGNPGVALPLQWERYESGKRATMIMDLKCHTEYDPNRAFYEFWKDIELYR